MVPVIELTQSQIEQIFAKWDADAKAKGWEKNEYNAKTQATQFWEYAEQLQRDGKL